MSYIYIMSYIYMVGKMAATSSPKEPSADDNTLTLDYWAERWESGSSGWHEADGCQLLWKHFKQLFKDNFPTKSAEDIRVFVPLCGKAKDMYMFYKLGFTVVGIEYAAQPIREFFEENGISVTEKKADSPFTTSQDGRLILGQGDLFNFLPNSGNAYELPFPCYDIVWDRGSFEAINDELRQKYADHMWKILAKDFLYIIQACFYDRREYKGPPLSASQSDLENYFGKDVCVSEIDETDMMVGSREEFWKGQGLTKLFAKLYVMKRH